LSKKKEKINVHEKRGWNPLGGKWPGNSINPGGKVETTHKMPGEKGLRESFCGKAANHRGNNRRFAKNLSRKRAPSERLATTIWGGGKENSNGLKRKGTKQRKRAQTKPDYGGKNDVNQKS